MDQGEVGRPDVLALRPPLQLRRHPAGVLTPPVQGVQLTEGPGGDGHAPGGGRRPFRRDHRFAKPSGADQAMGQKPVPLPEVAEELQPRPGPADGLVELPHVQQRDHGPECRERDEPLQLGVLLRRLRASPGDDRDPTWSPDGSRIAFSKLIDDYLNDWDVYVMAADGKDLTNVTDRPGHDGDPAWRPRVPTPPEADG